MAAAARLPGHLAPSELGTKEYWNECYEREIKNNQDDPEDEGTIWFEDSGAEEKMLALLQDIQPLPPCVVDDQDITQSESLRVLDVGTGNGHMLFSMAEDGWSAKMVGVDYSDASIGLARRIANAKVGEQPNVSNISFEQWDMLRDDPGEWTHGGFDVLLDKGTFDAISLSDQIVEGAGLRGCELYPRRLRPLLKTGGYFVITSCNWTEEEVRKWFESDTLEFHERATYPSFTFGGQKGQSVCTVCFRAK